MVHLEDVPDGPAPTFGRVPALQSVADLLGGTRLLKRRLATALDAHELILQGIPDAALKHLVDRVPLLRDAALLGKAVGMSVRTFQRRKGTTPRPLDPAQSARTWKFAEILAKATEIFGSQAEAERWLVQPAMGLAQRRPIDLLATPAGVALVEAFLERLEYGVYA
jgi:putative toxin-antitoxin system antitoxin component (TIGR02293 family)